MGIVLILAVLAAVAGTRLQAVEAPRISLQDKTAAQPIWTGTSGGFAIRWTTADLQARPVKKPGRLAFSAAELSRRGFRTFISPPNLDGSEKRVNYERKFTLLAVVGSILSLKDELYYEIIPSAHPGGETRFTAIDLAKSGKVSDPWAVEEGLNPKKLGKVAKLTDYFPEKEVLKALLSNAIIQEALEGESPRSLAEFLALLKSPRIDEITYSIPRDLLTRFVFHHLQENQVAVRLGLPSATSPARYMHAELELFLPIPPTLKESLTLAAVGKEGFLMAGQEKIASEAVTLIPFSFEGKGKVK